MNTPFIFGRLRKDEDGHWFLIPKELVEKFDSYMEKIYSFDLTEKEKWDLEDEFVANFENYRLSGGIDDLDVLMG